jgi:signal transduction histidine kinase
MTFPPLAPPDRRVVGGVCAGLADAVGVDPTLVRLMFTLLALAGGAGVVLYAAAYLAMRSARPESKVWPVVLLVVAASVALTAFGLSGHVVIALALVAGGLALIFRRGGSLRPDAPFSIAGAVLVGLGAAILLLRGGTSGGLVAPGAVGAALLLVGGPWLWQLGVERDAERTARIRTEEREEVAARVHDSVLQSLALIQKHAEEPKRVASLARRQERELRDWLYGHGAATGEDTLVSALTASAADVEDLHGVRIDLATTGDVALEDDVRAVVLATREAMANAAKFSGADEISVYAEADDGRVAVYVRDRGSGFDPAAVAADRRGIAESIEGRMTRVGGTALVTTAPGEGTEVELTLPRKLTLPRGSS